MSELRIEDRTKAYLVMLWTFWATVFSFSLAFPLCYWYRTRYFTPKKYIDGRRLRFEGKLIKMYIFYAIGLAITIGTIFLIDFLIKTYIKNSGIPSNIVSRVVNIIYTIVITFFIGVQEKRIVQQGTHFEDEVDKKSGFDMHFFLMLIKSLVVKLINTFSFGLLYPLSESLKYYYDYHRCYIDGYHFDYKFSIKKLYPRWLLDLLLIVVTFGFYMFAATLRIEERNITFIHTKKD